MHALQDAQVGPAKACFLVPLAPGALQHKVLTNATLGEARTAILLLAEENLLRTVMPTNGNDVGTPGAGSAVAASARDGRRVRPAG